MKEPAAGRILVARSLAVAAVVYAAAFYAVGAAVKPDYSSMAQYLSELNATGTAHATLLGWLGFAPVALLTAAFLVAATPLARVRGASAAGWALLWSVPIAFLGVALFPCDAGCPVGGSLRQSAHDLLGVTTYFASAAALVLLSFAPAHPAVDRAVRGFLRFAGAAFLVLFVLLLDPALASVRGLLQRLADGLLGAALLVLAWRFLERRPNRAETRG